MVQEYYRKERIDMENSKIVPISIFGSCVTRDVFEIDKDENMAAFDIKTYTARQTIVSSLSKPIRCDESDIVLDSAFQRRMVLCDMHKDTFKRFKKDKSDYIVIDLIDERLGMLKLKGSIATQSNELVNSGYTKQFDTERVRLTYKHGEFFVGDKPLKKYCEKFCRKLKRIYPQERIIIHRALGVSDYYDANGSIAAFAEDQAAKCANMNRQLNFMYDAIEEFIPRAHVIRTEGKFHGDAGHKWGLSIVHYEPGYYRYVYEALDRITTKKDV